MAHIALREIEDDDLDAIFEMMRDPRSVASAAFTADDPDDRRAFDAWIARVRETPGADSFVVTANGGFAGTAAAFSVEDDREISFWIARSAQGRGVATEAARLLIAHEAQRPLFARVAAHNAASIAVLTKIGFTEVSRDVAFAPGSGRDVEEIVMTLVPTLE